MYLPNKKRPWLPWLAGFLLIAFLVAFFHFLGGILTPFIVAAVITPPDVLSQILLAVPMILLYEGGLLVCRIVRPRAKDTAASEEAA